MSKQYQELPAIPALADADILTVADVSIGNKTSRTTISELRSYLNIPVAVETNLTNATWVTVLTVPITDLGFIASVMVTNYTDTYSELVQATVAEADSQYNTHGVYGGHDTQVIKSGSDLLLQVKAAGSGWFALVKRLH